MVGQLLDRGDTTRGRRTRRKMENGKRNRLISMAGLLACNRVGGSPAPPRRTTRPRWAQWPPRCPRRPAGSWFSFSWASAAPGGLATLSDANNASQAGGLGGSLQKDTKPSENGAAQENKGSEFKYTFPAWFDLWLLNKSEFKDYCILKGCKMFVSISF